jgi:hypothetical protein
MNSKYTNYRAIVIIVAAAAIGGELTARYAGFGQPPLAIRDDKIEYYSAPSRSYMRFGHDYYVNRYGMRSDDMDVTAVDSRFSFSVLGDSVVYGNRLDQADTVSAKLQKLLMAKTNGNKVLVNSIAASSWGPENLLEFYKRFGPFPGNIAWVVQSSADMVDVIDPVNKILPYRTASPYCALQDLALGVWHAALSGMPGKADPLKLEDKRRRADIALRALITALKADYTRVILIFHATRDEAINGNAGGLAYYPVVAKEQAIDFISTMDLYAHAYRSNLPPHYDDIHLSKEGARMLSELLAVDIVPLNSRD